MGHRPLGSHPEAIVSPALPMQEVYLRPPTYPLNPDEVVVSLERDSVGVWWHVKGGQPIRPASPEEVLLLMAPTAWARFYP